MTDVRSSWIQDAWIQWMRGCHSSMSLRSAGCEVQQVFPTGVGNTHNLSSNCFRPPDPPVANLLTPWSLQYLTPGPWSPPCPAPRPQPSCQLIWLEVCGQIRYTHAHTRGCGSSGKHSHILMFLVPGPTDTRALRATAPSPAAGTQTPSIHTRARSIGSSSARKIFGNGVQ